MSNNIIDESQLSDDKLCDPVQGFEKDGEAIIVACPPLSDYPEAPKDQSHSELFKCPKCKEQMWLSQKKKGILMFSSCIGKEIILACYHCITKMVQEDPSLVLDLKMINL